MTVQLPKASIRVHVKPRAARPGLIGLDDDGTVYLALASPPVEGRANDEARRRLAELLDVAPSAVTLARGVRSRHKVMTVAGLSAAQALARLRRSIER